MAELLTIARPYADAAFSIARDGAALPQWSDALSRLAQVMEASEAASLVENPRLNPDQIATLIADAAGSLTPEQRNFVRVLAANDRLVALPEIANQFQSLRNGAEGSLDVTIDSAYPLTEAQIDDIRATLEQKYGRQVRATAQVDTDLIGGVLIRIGDEVVDASVKGRLARLAASFKN